jgi:hypothetical protein
MRASLWVVFVMFVASGCGRAPWVTDGGDPVDSGPKLDKRKVDVYPWDDIVRRDVRPWDIPRPPDYYVPDYHKPDYFKKDYSPLYTEKVTCKFSGSSGSQECFSSKGATCKGVGSCTVTVSGTLGEKIDWKSTCGSNIATTIIDGKNETALFYCSSVVSETVTCVFAGSSTPGMCWSSYGSCSGIGSCKVVVNGTPGQKISWGSSCGAASMSTTLDGVDESITFKCGMAMSETITCLFSGSSTQQDCSSPLGGCKGIKSCSVVVSGTAGDQVYWKSSCGGSAITTIDGKSETIDFLCTPSVTETVTCLFNGSTTFQQCYASTGASCQGLLGCTVSVSGSMGDVISWKSSCGGYATTITDGKNETASFTCASFVDGGPPPPIFDGGAP